MSNNPKPKPLAKPTGLTLEEHIGNLLKQAEIALEMRPFVVRKYLEMTGEDFASAVKQSARWHDKGKEHPIWQNACRSDFEIYQTFSEAEKKSLPNSWAKHLQKAGIRHELASLEFIHRLQANVSVPVRVAVAAHHGKLGEKNEHRWQEYNEFQKFWDEFYGLGHSFQTGEKESFEQAIKARYRFAGVRAWLQMIDHRASAFEDGQELPPLGTFSYKFPYEAKRGVQLEAEKIWDEPFAILRAPTGAGKTDAALLWANHQVEKGRADRLIVAMPTRFTANSLSISTTEKNFKNLGDAGLYHSSAWYQRIKDKLHPTWKEKSFINKEQDLARKLETPFTVTTIDHLCISLTGTREDHHAIFFGLAHSCVVIDESDFYDDFTQQNIVTLLRVLRILKVPVLLMSATVPESARKTFSKSGFTIEKIHADESDAERPRCSIKRYGKAEKPKEIEELLERALTQPTIIYANTVSRAQAYYRWFSERTNPENVVLYHSRFIEPHKVIKENRLREMLGKEAWEKGDQYGIAILTQIGEISVNISADLMISDLCPLDRLAQRVGRLSRFSENIGELFVIEPQRTNKNGEIEFYPAPYGSFSPNSGWQTSEALTLSNEFLKDGNYSAKDFVDLVNQLYPSELKIESHVRANVRALEDMIVTNWLILPAIKVEQDDDNVESKWKSRDVAPQTTVFADYDIWFDNQTTCFDNQSERKEFEIRHGIQCYSWQIKRAIEENWIDPITFTIREEDEVLFIVNSRFYNPEVGLNFPFSKTVED